MKSILPTHSAFRALAEENIASGHHSFDDLSEDGQSKLIAAFLASVDTVYRFEILAEGVDEDNSFTKLMPHLFKDKINKDVVMNFLIERIKDYIAERIYFEYDQIACYYNYHYSEKSA